MHEWNRSEMAEYQRYIHFVFLLRVSHEVKRATYLISQYIHTVFTRKMKLFSVKSSQSQGFLFSNIPMIFVRIPLHESVCGKVLALYYLVYCRVGPMNLCCTCTIKNGAVYGCMVNPKKCTMIRVRADNKCLHFFPCLQVLTLCNLSFIWTK